MESPTSAAVTTARYTCLKLEIPTASDPQQTEPIFVKGTWYHSHFTLSITDGRDAWLCDASEDDVRERASQWDQPAAEYIELAERYLGFQQPGSIYAFSDAGNGYRRLSWTFEKEGTKLEWRWRCKPSPNSKKTTADILDFLMDANIQLSMTKCVRAALLWLQKEEVVRKTQAFDRLKEEAEKCLAQSERLSAEKDEFESGVYAKFVSVLNSKKAKLRELRDRLSKQQSTGKLRHEKEEEEESSDRTEPFISGSDDGNCSEEKPAEVLAGTSKRAPVRNPRGRKRGARI